jgi:hypothetical protein
MDVSPLVDTTKDRPGLDPGFLDSLPQYFDRPADQDDIRRVIGRRRLGTAETDGLAGQERGGRISPTGMHRPLVDQILDAQIGGECTYSRMDFRRMEPALTAVTCFSTLS